MSHEIYRDHFLYAHGTPPAWHQIGNEMPENATIQDWLKTDAFNWEILEGVAECTTSDGQKIVYPARKILYRSDTMQPLAVVGDGFQIVQPADVLNWFRTACDDYGMTMETAGILREGCGHFALANTHEAVNINGDVLKRYMLLATANDGRMNTCASDTSTRVVCKNTQDASIGVNGSKAKAKLSHRSAWNEGDELKRQLGILNNANAWHGFVESMLQLVDTKVDAKQAAQFMADLHDPEANYKADGEKGEKARKSVERWMRKIGDDLMNAPGQEHPNAKNTAYGLVQAVTYHVDHNSQARSDHNRMHSGWFGPGNTLKNRATQLALAIAGEQHTPSRNADDYAMTLQAQADMMAAAPAIETQVIEETAESAFASLLNKPASNGNGNGAGFTYN